jgi:hypothetical protein
MARCTNYAGENVALWARLAVHATPPHIVEGEFDTARYEDIWDAIRHEGRLVGRQEWDSGGPGAGAGVVDVYLYRGAFYADNDAEAHGPCETFDKAAKAVGLFIETSATKRIWVDPQIGPTRRS